METDEDYKVQAMIFKDRGNEAFQANNIEEAIKLYSQV
jgi:hypothetical protein